MSQRSDRAKHTAPSVKAPAGNPDPILIGRLALSAVLLAVVIFVKMPAVIKVILGVLSAVAAGYDLGLKAFDSILEGDYFATPTILLFVTFVSFLVGFGTEGAAMLLLYQLGLILIAYVEKRTRASAFGLLNNLDEENTQRAKELFEEEDAGKLSMSSDAYQSANFLLKIAMILALVYTFVLPLLGDYDYRVSIHRGLMILMTSIPASVVLAMPFTGLVGLCFSARQGVVFHDAKAMERAAGTNVAVFDKAGVFSAGEPQLLSMQSDVLDARTFMSFAAHAVYYSEQPFAKAIPQLAEQDYRLDVISDFVDVPGVGVELKIGGSPVILATAEYLAARGVQVPEADDKSENYYLTVAGRYVGTISVSSKVKDNATDLVNGIREVGFRSTVLLTEDGAGESRRLAEELGMSEVFGECDTERKLKHVSDLNQGTRNRVMFIYANGLETHSDADVDVRISKKAKFADAEIAPEHADALPFGIQISRRMCEVAKENAFFVFGVKALMIFLSMIGFCSIWFVMFMDIVATVATLLNAIRVTQPPLIDLKKNRENLEDYE